MRDEAFLVRRCVWVALLATVVVAVVVGCGGSKASVRLRTGIAYGDTLVWDTDVQLAAALDTARYVGATTVRADLSWNDVEDRGPGSFSWKAFDHVVSAAAARGLTVLPVLADTPPWARPAGCASADCGPADPAAFAAFARAAAERYAPRGVHLWEVWNEPNTTEFWRPAPDPDAYTRLLTATAAAIRRTDRHAFVVLGGLAATSAAHGNVSQTDFLARVCALGGTRAVNAVGYHPYTYPYLPSAVTSWGTPWERIDETPVSLTSVLTSCGTPRLPIWITEVGAPTGGPGRVSDGSSSAVPTTHVTDALQARIASDAVRTADADPRVGGLFWYTDRDRPGGTGLAANENSFGLYRVDGTPKPALGALRDAIAALRRSRLS